MHREPVLQLPNKNNRAEYGIICFQLPLIAKVILLRFYMDTIIDIVNVTNVRNSLNRNSIHSHKLNEHKIITTTKKY